jgi:branched-chain amino acid transport system permease protein
MTGLPILIRSTAMFWLGVFLITAVMMGRGGIMGALSRFIKVGNKK